MLRSFLSIRVLAPLSILLLIGITACTSLPLPDSAREGMLVIPTDVSRSFRDGQGKIVRIVCEIVPAGAETGEETEPFHLIIRQKDEFTAAALEEGDYIITEYTVYSTDSGAEGSTAARDFEAGISFSVEKRVVRLFEYGFYLTPDDSPAGYESGFRQGIPEEQKRKILEKLVRDDRWIAWGSYPKLNFPETEDE